MRSPLIEIPSRALLWACGIVLLCGAPTLGGTLQMQLTHNRETPERPEIVRFYLFDPEGPEHYIAWGNAERSSVRVPDGTYDVEVRFEYGFVVRTRKLEGLVIEGTIERSINFDVPISRLTVDVSAAGRSIRAHSGRIAVYRQGDRGKPIGMERPGKTMFLRPGTYDLEVSYFSDEGLKSTWLVDYPIDGDQYESVPFGGPRALLTVTLERGGRRIPPDEGTWRAFPAGSRAEPMGESGSGLMMALPEGLYDLQASLADGSEERWLEGVEVRGEITREIEMRPPGDFRVTAPRLGQRRSKSWVQIYRPGRHAVPVASGDLGEKLSVQDGTYDIQLVMRDREFRAERWLERQPVDATSPLEIDLECRAAYLRIDPGRRQRRRTPDPELWIVFDRSELMTLRGPDSGWFDVARQTLARLVPELDDDLKVGLYTFGGDPGARGCGAFETVGEARRDDRRDIVRALGSMNAAGETPLADALRRLGNVEGEGAHRSLVVITSNLDTCGGDYCGAAADALRGGAFGRSYLIGLGVRRDTLPKIDCLGETRTAQSAAELRSALREIARETARDVRGAVTLFNPQGHYVVGGAFGERLPVCEGRYEVVLTTPNDVFLWRDYLVRGNGSATAGPRP